MAGRTTEVLDAFLRFLMAHFRDAEGNHRPKANLYQLANAIGRSIQLINKYNVNGIYDTRKRAAMVLACNIDPELYIDWLSDEQRTLLNEPEFIENVS